MLINSTKYLFNKSLGEKAEEKYKSSKVEEATKVHSRIADEMFEL